MSSAHDLNLDEAEGKFSRKLIKAILFSFVGEKFQSFIKWRTITFLVDQLTGTDKKENGKKFNDDILNLGQENWTRYKVCCN